jgi:hypothetical protein
MSKHNKKNTLSFVILSLLTAAPALTSAGGWLGGFRILAHLTAGLGFNIGKTKIKRNNLSVSDALKKGFLNLDNDYFGAINNELVDWNEDLNNSELVKLAKGEQSSIGEIADDKQLDEALAKLTDADNKFKQEIIDKRKAIIKAHDEGHYNLDLKPQPIPESTRLKELVDPNENTAERNKLASILGWSDDYLKELFKDVKDNTSPDGKGSDGKDSEIYLGDEPVFPASGDYDCNVPNFWRRLELSGEVSALFQALDWLGIGLHGGLTGSLHQAELNDISRIRDSVSFSIKFGGAIQITKWFQCAVMAAAERHSFKRDALDINSTDNSDSVKKEIGNYDYINNLLSYYRSTAEEQDENMSKRVQKAVSQQQAYLQKEFIDSFEFSGWSWGIKIQPAFFLWLNEMIALKVGVEFTLPISEIKQFTPAPRAAVLFGVVISII